MLISNYQKTELIIGTVLFPLFYFLFLYFTAEKIIYWDVIWCTFSLFIIILFKTFYVNYYILQRQNISSNVVIDGSYSMDY